MSLVQIRLGPPFYFINAGHKKMKRTVLSLLFTAIIVLTVFASLSLAIDSSKLSMECALERHPVSSNPTNSYDPELSALTQQYNFTENQPDSELKALAERYRFRGKLNNLKYLEKAEINALEKASAECPAGERPCVFTKMIARLGELKDIKMHDALASHLVRRFLMENKMAEANRMDLLIKDRSSFNCYIDDVCFPATYDVFIPARLSCAREESAAGKPFDMDACINIKLNHKECGSPVHCDVKANRYKTALVNLPTEVERQQYLQELLHVLAVEGRIAELNEIRKSMRRNYFFNPADSGRSSHQQCAYPNSLPRSDQELL